MKRILITGGRSRRDKEVMRWAISSWVEKLGSDVVLVSGHASKGADFLCEQIADELGIKVEPHPANWNMDCLPTCNHGGRGERNICKQAGFIRNQEMVDLGADVCLAFPGNTGGTWDCVRRSKTAGILTYTISKDYEVKNLSN